MGRVYTTIQFALQTIGARRWDAFHSPYLFSLFTKCCDDRWVEPTFRLIESKRKAWIDSAEIINRKDFGAGSSYEEKQDLVPISRIAKHSLSLPFQCRFMSRLAAFSNAGHIVELGTSLGISAAYLAAGAPEARIDTVEGDSEIAGKAKEMLDSLYLANVNVHNASFEDFTARHNPGLGKIDILFLDGDHRLEATLGNYQSLKAYFHSGTIVVVDDIYWSREMNTCWKTLMALPEVTQSADCFHFGLLFFKPDFLSKENHIIRLPMKMLMKTK